MTFRFACHISSLSPECCDTWHPMRMCACCVSVTDPITVRDPMLRGLWLVIKFEGSNLTCAFCVHLSHSPRRVQFPFVNSSLESLHGISPCRVCFKRSIRRPNYFELVRKHVCIKMEKIDYAHIFKLPQWGIYVSWCFDSLLFNNMWLV